MMTLRYLRAISASLQFEGESYTDDPADPGGATKYGLTWRFLQDAIGSNAIHPSELTLNDALSIYLAHIWEPGRFDVYARDGVALKTFDITINMGPGEAGRLLQTALNDVLHGAWAPLVVDGNV